MVKKVIPIYITANIGIHKKNNITCVIWEAAIYIYTCKSKKENNLIIIIITSP